MTRVDVDGVGLARLDLAARRMADRVDPRVLDRRDHALGHLRGGHAERRVHRADDPVQPRQQVVVVVRRAVGQDVRLGAGEDLDALDARVGLGDALDLALELVGRDVVAEAVRRRVVGDRDVLIAAVARRERHLLDRGVPVGRGRVHVQVAADVVERDQPRRLESPARARRGPRAARARGRRGRGARRPPPRSRSAASRRSRRRGSRTRETCSPRRTAASRSATLCACEPVKCCSRLPKFSGSTTRRSTGMPVCVRPRAACSLGAVADSITSSSPSARASAAGSEAVAMMSRSLTESAWRRAEPASSTRSEAGCARSASTIASPMLSARLQQHALRGPRRRCRRRSSPAPISSNFGPKPLDRRAAAGPRRRRAASPASRCPARRTAAAPSSARGPAAASCPAGRAGTSRAASAAAGIVPVSSSATSFSSSVLPIPGSAVTVPSRVIAATETVASRAALAARAVGEHAVHDRAVELVEVGELVEGGGDGEVRRV